MERKVPDWVERMIVETMETADRLNALNKFMQTKKFVQLDRKNKQLRYKQQRAMSTYLETLGEILEVNGYSLELTEAFSNRGKKKNA